MKTFSLFKIKLFFTTSLVAFLFCSCSKDPNTVTGTDEFIHYTVNGVPYNFDIPTDSVFTSPDSVETPSFKTEVEVFGKRFFSSSANTVRITFDKSAIAAGSMQSLKIFITPEIIGYLYNTPTFSTSPTPVMVNITEFGAIGQYIAGDFSCALTGPPPAATYNITCSFRVIRKR